jgi:spore photoproduct lyase
VHPQKRIRRIIVEAEARGYEMTRRVCARLPGVPVEVVPSREALLARKTGPAGLWREAKTTLLLAVQKGPFWRSCPGTRDYICCGYQVLQVALNCPLDCTYCVLQGYVNFPALTVFVNVEDLLAELAARMEAAPSKIWRLGTGEFGDSLALDELTGLNERLIPFFAGRPQALLEIKSKWHGVSPLLQMGPNPQVIFSWSLNPTEVIRDEERFTSSLKERLQAARQAAAAGFRVAFHFDPLIYFPGWEGAYARTVAVLGQMVPGAAVAWISLGALRFMPAMREIILERHPVSRIAAQEFVRAPDGKLRYYKDLRIEMYSRMREWLQAALPSACVYLCMESPRVWQAVFGVSPTEDELSSRLDEQVATMAPAGV